MAEYKVVDAEQLDAELKSLANKIREKGGTTEELDFYKGDFTNAVGAIESGGDDLPDWDDDSPIIASGNGYYTSTIWEVTEKGTMRWRMNPDGDGYGAYYNAAGWGNSIGPKSQKHITVSSKIKQLDIGEGITRIWLGYMPNCKRIRVMEEMETVNLVQFGSLPHIIVDNFKEISLQSCGSIERVELPETLTALKAYAFSSSYSIKEINLQNIVTFGNNCLNGCVSLSSDITFNANLKAINTKAFVECSIKSLTFKNSTDSLPTIAKDAFNGCTQLLNIYVPWSLDEVDNAPWGATSATIHYNTTYDAKGNPQCPCHSSAEV